MAQIIITLMSAILLITVPVGVLQIHTVLFVRSELMEVSLAATKFISNHGGKSDSDAQQKVTAFINAELSQKPYTLSSSEVSIQINRLKGADPVLWSHEDEFQIRLTVPYPKLTQLFPVEERPITIERVGTINTMSYDL